MGVEMKLEELLCENSITISLLVEDYGFECFSSGKISCVDSDPQNIYFGEGRFLASFIFNQDKLDSITLVPIIESVQEPNYPSEEYQLVKKKYCINVLNKMYGEPFCIDEFNAEWNIGAYTISCYTINEGKGKYSGGDIIINAR